MTEPYSQFGRILAGIILVALLTGSLVLAGTTTGDPLEGAYPDESDVTPTPEEYVGEQVILGGFVVDTDPVVIATRASGYGQFVLVDVNTATGNIDAPLEIGDRVNTFGTLEDDSALVVERAITREGSEAQYMYLVSALGGLWVVWRFINHWRFDRSALAFRPRAQPLGSRLGGRDDSETKNSNRSQSERRPNQTQDAVAESQDNDGQSTITDDRPAVDRHKHPEKSTVDGGERHG
ncbi:hypothetical protein [Natronorubrum tibetense]|uniref:OB-fold tRNA/helicase-type nucleic acid binding protein n=1 Tax=Natronorubrum tibetense GA33 TaxID=1114856 RepID=L9VNJ4_9EURY|nr:hypothetical protein [Natronorubrum tibetense]ELY37823.1 hypothetical protein C496_20015 [Natronorubrum tibetense GA33]